MNRIIEKEPNYSIGLSCMITHKTTLCSKPSDAWHTKYVVQLCSTQLPWVVPRMQRKHFKEEGLLSTFSFVSCLLCWKSQDTGSFLAAQLLFLFDDDACIHYHHHFEINIKSKMSNIINEMHSTPHTFYLASQLTI